MIRKIFFALSLLLFTCPLTLPAEAEPQKSHSYLALPANAPAPAPAIILIHEWWGLNDQIRKIADDFAAQGYVAFAVDLYEGKNTGDPTEAHELMRGLPEDRALQTLKDAVSFLKAHPVVDPHRVAVIGWCMGGGYALQLALEEPSLKAAVMYYGRLVTDETKLASLKTPLLGIFGAEDRGISKESVEKFKRDLERLGKSAEIHIYEGAGHAFANPENAGYRPDAAKEAWGKTVTFLKQRLA